MQQHAHQATSTAVKGRLVVSRRDHENRHRGSSLIIAEDGLKHSLSTLPMLSPVRDTQANLKLAKAATAKKVEALAADDETGEGLERKTPFTKVCASVGRVHAAYRIHVQLN